MCWITLARLDDAGEPGNEKRRQQPAQANHDPAEPTQRRWGKCPIVYGKIEDCEAAPLVAGFDEWVPVT